MAKTAPRAAIVAAARTAIGTARKGTLANMTAVELAKPVTKAAVERSGLAPADFDDFILAEVLQGGGDSARYIAVDLGLLDIPGMAVNRQCASSLSAIAVGAGQIAAGMSRAVLAGGMESASTAPMLRKRKPFTAGKSPEDYDDPWFPFSHPPTEDAPAVDMSITVAHNCAVQYGITREDQDKWALRSHQRAIKAIDAGSFVDEIVPIEVPQADGSTITFAVDEHPRRDTSLEILAGLKVLHPEIEGFTVTAGNSSGVNDAAAVVALTAPDAASDPLGYILSWAQVGIEPNRTGSGPIYAIPKALELAGLTLRDVALFEINEAFAAQAVACARQLELDEEIVNVYGSGISLGHPIAATGARMVTSAVHELRRRGGGIGVLSMCAGGGMGAAMVIEVK
ncbi:acetyl-CoA C-acetyltransferase family protein [Mycolicibacterium hassiacum DSM 44199]|jgi:acetyl-CoA C-acetyltransferase|uniref:Probable acetyl-CoA acetyltransferase n=1 Tax=Mycolicibacterium hassiacum (strain DSM 44199 / CIP 105218 / JCM 12690 / 3849) TaxID=1122247 RepID=K5BCM4_MYCHD|nr:thiolase family protein [Mycolicibacterium hassiacum]EKF21677.1 acetyl-CoA C-acetyltransferase family protein [Mycolicibacterium hassiacum DSM 44199]MBX5487491.1 thiolase family protein [Mycolicibacterium hassiacum]MDA4084233.1 acetyl-CoA acetyltransferase [Mycolicibacterium hassiacum DSM 44199]PZN25068.1 MAG: acetyl-CoA C-acyltransferase [Mycolicibacterium hassiacum]VCT91242.1 3-ketoacyl-CoA thiolase [Mycolicibacterium hassiacum DSM 44199]